jgi:hypothetical protein
MSDFEPNQTVYLPDGREAIYVMQNGDQHFVRIIWELEDRDYGPYSEPEDKITAAAKVYATAPVEVWDAQVLAKREQVRELDRELTAKRQEIADAARRKTDMEKPAVKYPCIQQALDFIEGRITHVVVWSGYGGAQIQTLQEAFEDVDTWGGRRKFEGMKLLNLFGTDDRGRPVAWGLNTYRDGSGGTQKHIWPAHNEGHAMQILGGLFHDAVAAWRSGEKNWHVGHIGITETLKLNSWLTAPEDWIAYRAEQIAKNRADQIANLREQIAKLEAEE